MGEYQDAITSNQGTRNPLWMLFDRIYSEFSNYCMHEHTFHLCKGRELIESNAAYETRACSVVIDA
jgi:hypothetical protein